MIPPWPQTALLRRLLFLLGNLAAGLALFFACVVPVRQLLADRDREILQLHMTLSRLREVTAREATVQSQAKRTVLGQGEFLAGKTDGVIAAEMQARLKRMVQAAGARLRSIRNLQPKTDAQIKHVGSHIEFSGPIAAVHRALHAIESAKPYLFVTGGTIRLAPPMGGAGAPQAPLIEAQLDIVGVTRIEAREP